MLGVRALGSAPLLAVSALVAASINAEPIQIAGPNGPLEAELTEVAGAAHVLVIIPGSAPTDCSGNGSSMGLSSDTYLLLADGLAEVGIASLRIDKRGFFGSEAAIAYPSYVTVAAYAEDARAWVTSRLSCSVAMLAQPGQQGLLNMKTDLRAPRIDCRAASKRAAICRPRVCPNLASASTRALIQPMLLGCAKLEKKNRARVKLISSSHASDRSVR